MRSVHGHIHKIRKNIGDSMFRSVCDSILIKVERYDEKTGLYRANGVHRDTGVDCPRCKEKMEQ